MPRLIPAILFDLDNTLYDARAGLQEVGDRRITCWIMRELGLDRPEADALRERTWRQYGTTARGLAAEFGLPPKLLYEEAISSIEPAEHLQPWPELAAMLARLAADRHVFTNATAVYARKVLAALGVGALFGRIFDIEHNGWVCKPDPGIYRGLLTELGLPPQELALVEDNPRNLEPARDLGMLTVLVDHAAEPAGSWDVQISSILDLADALEQAGVQA